MGHHSTNVYKHKIDKGKKILICRHDWTFSSSLMTDWETDRAEITTTQQHLWRCSGQECQGYWQEAGVSLLCAGVPHSQLPAPSSSVRVIEEITSPPNSPNGQNICPIFLISPSASKFKILIRWNLKCVKMGCAHASKILTNDDIEFIAKNTALSKDQVEVFKRSFIEI